MAESSWANADEKNYLHYIGSYCEDFDSHGLKSTTRKTGAERWVDSVLKGEIDCHGRIYLRDRIDRLYRYIELSENREAWGDIDMDLCCDYAEKEIATAKKLLGE